MIQRIVTVQWVPYTVDVVFAFFANPHNLPALMPAGLKTRIDTVRLASAPPSPMSAGGSWASRPLAAGIGSEIELSFRPVRYLPMRLHWVARVTEFVWYSHFCDEQTRGPFERFRHRHGIRSEIQEGRIGTLITDEIEYALPFGSVGHLWDAAVRRQLKRTFSLRQERLPIILDSVMKQMA
jgi:ligand-binding SRPBCC domain-containing protein